MHLNSEFAAAVAVNFALPNSKPLMSTAYLFLTSTLSSRISLLTLSMPMPAATDFVMSAFSINRLSTTLSAGFTSMS
ncbi:hypothetical protein J4234_00210 [Candidatus Woesearchaeota archaeon]|nr:hypothetical protein [Candidatus Woesearchaeota archaeon]